MKYALVYTEGSSIVIDTARQSPEHALRDAGDELDLAHVVGLPEDGEDGPGVLLVFTREWRPASDATTAHMTARWAEPQAPSSDG